MHLLVVAYDGSDLTSLAGLGVRGKGLGVRDKALGVSDKALGVKG